MNKIILIAIACGVVTALLLKRNGQKQLRHAPAPHLSGNAGKHITNVFSRAKKQGL